MATFEALRIAQERGLDLVEVAPTAMPPVCRLMDYGRFKYEQTKKEREARKNQKIVELKEVRLTPRTDEHDVAAKSKMIQKFLEDGDKVKVTIRFRGRELAHPQLGRQVLEEISNTLTGVAIVERPPLLEGRSMFMILTTPGARSAQQAAFQAPVGAIPPRPPQVMVGSATPPAPNANARPPAPPDPAVGPARVPSNAPPRADAGPRPAVNGAPVAKPAPPVPTEPRPAISP